MVIQQCICGGFYRKGNYSFHTNSWIHKLYKVLKRRDEELLRFQNNFVDEEDLIDDRCSNASTQLPESETLEDEIPDDNMTYYDSN